MRKREQLFKGISPIMKSDKLAYFLIKEGVCSVFYLTGVAQAADMTHVARVKQFLLCPLYNWMIL